MNPGKTRGKDAQNRSGVCARFFKERGRKFHDEHLDSRQSFYVDFVRQACIHKRAFYFRSAQNTKGETSQPKLIEIDRLRYAMLY
jgi:hypothetical protein